MFADRIEAKWIDAFVQAFTLCKIGAGDINLTLKRYLERPVELVIEDDFITDIRGEGTDAELMRRYFAAWSKRDAYAGNFLYSAGASEFAGRYTAGHFDLPVRGCTVALDGEAVVRAGKLVR